MNIEKAKQLIAEADAVLITAGAGMGVDSGLPDFRGDAGFWKAYPPIKKLGISFSSMANPQWFETDPHFAWAFYGHRLNLYRETIPHEGFEILKKLGEGKKEGYFVYTSNVDGQFQKAGFDESKIVEVHGSIHHLQCTEDCQASIWSANNENLEIDMEDFTVNYTPQCPHCSNVARPNIMMFGDWRWNDGRTNKQHKKFNKWIKKLKVNKYKLVIIEIGAGEAIPTIRDKGDTLARQEHINLIRVNPRDYDVDEKNGVSIPLGGLEWIKKLEN
jgi:NAD-dependent SIR2 family protein deacetylase